MSVMKKQLMKVRQIADQTIFRSEKTEVLNKELEQTEKRLDGLKQPCQILYKKMRACHQGCQEPLDKRRKHMPELQLSNSMSELLDTHLEGNILLWEVLDFCSKLQESLGVTLLEAQQQSEKDVIVNIQDFSEKEIHNVGKLRKQLFKLSQDMDSARFRYESSVKNLQPQSGPALLKVEGFKEEVEELSMKVEQARDTYAAEIYGLVSRESSICQSFVQWYEMQTAYHEKCLHILNNSTPTLQKLIDKSTHHPLFGHSLEDHLQRTGREIALVVEACVLCLLETAINEEGLFRIAGSASKVKKLKNALDAGVTNMYEYVTDPHAVAGALKSYLRALPEPLMTYSAYDDWIQADRISDSDARLQRLWQVLNVIPKANYNNLRYLIKFLHCLCKNSEHNKMSSQNMSIVFAPNLLWSPASQQSNHIGLNMSAANAHSSIVETLISYCDWFFPEEVVFRQTLGPLPSPKGLLTPPIVDEGSAGSLSVKGIINTAFEGANGESEDSVSGNGQSPRVIHRPGKKPAPPVPQVPGSQSSDTTVETSPNPRESPPNRLVERPAISRSATLDRPGKPKRASTRKSHDNLASLLPYEDTQLASIPGDQFPEMKSEPELSLAPTANKKESSAAATSVAKKDPTNQQGDFQGSIANHLSIVKERSIERANWFMGDAVPPGKKEQGSQQPPQETAAVRSQSSARKDEGGPTKEPQMEQDAGQTKSDNSSNVQDSAEQNTIIRNKSSETDNRSQGASVQRLASFLENANRVATTQSGATVVGQDANADVPFAQAAPPTRRKDAVKQPSQESIPQLYATENPSSAPVYENISCLINKSMDPAPQQQQQHQQQQQQHQQQQQQQQTVDRVNVAQQPTPGPKCQDQKVVNASANQAEAEGTPHSTVCRPPEVMEKPQVPSKPAAILGESRITPESSSQACSGETDSLGEEQGSRCVGDKWQFLTSGQRPDKIPDRPPKVAAEAVDAGDGKKPPPSPSTRIKPPRPQPPAPPAKPKLNNDAEDTRL